MAYNLNYNQGTEYDNGLQHRKTLIILIIILVLIAIGLLIWIGWNPKANITTQNQPKLTEEQKAKVREDLQKPPETPLTVQEKSQTKNDLAKKPPTTLTEEQKAQIREDLKK